MTQNSANFEQSQTKVPVVLGDEVKLVSTELAERFNDANESKYNSMRVLKATMPQYECLNPEQILMKVQNDAIKSKDPLLKEGYSNLARAFARLVTLKPTTDEEAVLASLEHLEAFIKLMLLTYDHFIREANNPSCKSWVYFMLNEDRNIVKIGYSCNPEWRVDTFRAGTLDKLTILKTIPGGRKEESEKHKTFAKYRINKRKEWFKYEGELKAYIKSL
jgi:hypothetical protein